MYLFECEKTIQMIICTISLNKQEYVINNNDILPYKISVCQVNGIWGEGESRSVKV